MELNRRLLDRVDEAILRFVGIQFHPLYDLEPEFGGKGFVLFLGRDMRGVVADYLGDVDAAKVQVIGVIDEDGVILHQVAEVFFFDRTHRVLLDS
jgi:hypothetical protein